MAERMAGPNFSPFDLRTIENAIKEAESEINKLSKIVEDVEDMGRVSLFLDSMVPKNERGWFNFVNLKSSDPKVLVTEIEKLKSYHDDMKKAITAAMNGNLDDLDVLISGLSKNLDEVTEDAEFGVDSTDSRTLRKAYMHFISNRRKMENHIRRVETIGLRKKQRDLTEKWEKSMEVINNLTEELRISREEFRRHMAGQ